MRNNAKNLCGELMSELNPILKGKNALVVCHKDVEAHLGRPKFSEESRLKIAKPGVVIGLAWTSFGGETLYVESIRVPGKGGLRLTGSLGEVMSESASIGFSYVLNRLDEFGISKLPVSSVIASGRSSRVSAPAMSDVISSWIANTLAAVSSRSHVFDNSRKPSDVRLSCAEIRTVPPYRLTAPSFPLWENSSS